jgi:regulator of replication initiation timing
LGAKQLAESRVLVSETTKYNSLLTEATKIKAENEEFRKALKVFRGQLVETVVFNSNLTYTTRLFMEHATTKSEKQDIIKRFDNGFQTY